jgi:hypothetical protein
MLKNLDRALAALLSRGKWSHIRIDRGFSRPSSHAAVGPLRQHSYRIDECDKSTARPETG